MVGREVADLGGLHRYIEVIAGDKEYLGSRVVQLVREFGTRVRCVRGGHGDSRCLSTEEEGGVEDGVPREDEGSVACLEPCDLRETRGEAERVGHELGVCDGGASLCGHEEVSWQLGVGRS